MTDEETEHLRRSEADELRETLEAYKEATGIVDKIGVVDALNAAINKEAERAAKLAIQNEKLWNVVRQAAEFAKNIEMNYDCDRDAHRYGTHCRCCDAAEFRKVIEALKENTK